MVVVACRVMKPELEKLGQHDDRVEISYLEQGLHFTPQKMAPFVQQEVDRAAEYASQVILACGLCSNGTVGVTARQQGLIVPRCHDCMAFFLGSPAAYEHAVKAHQGTYYLPPGWISTRMDPLSIIEDKYTPRVGRELAIWTMKEELKHYSRIVLVDTGIMELGVLRHRAMENARFFNKEYEEIKSSLDYFRRLLWGPRTRDNFILLEAGEAIEQSMFLGNNTAAKTEAKTVYGARTTSPELSR